jgi:hypothetical protein
MGKQPGKPVEQMTEREMREWKEWLFAQGVHPVPIREHAFPVDPCLRMGSQEQVGF